MVMMLERTLTRVSPSLVGTPEGAKADVLPEALRSFEEGLALVDQHNFQGALQAFEQVLAYKPDSSAAWNNKGLVLWLLERWEEALAAYEVALRLEADDPIILNNLGAALGRLGKFSEALEAVERALGYREDFPEAWCNKGTALAQLKQYPEALKAFERALNYRKELPEAWLGKGASLAALARNKEALKAYDVALTHREDLAEAWLGKGGALGRLGRFQEALDAYERALIYKTADDLLASLGKAVALWGLKKYDEALQTFEQLHKSGNGLAKEAGFVYKHWATAVLQYGLEGLLSHDISAFEKAGWKYIDVLEKAQRDGMSQVVEGTLTQFKGGLKKNKECMAFEELELFINLMKIKDPFDGWRALGKAISERWPKGLSAVQAVREMRR